MTDKIFFDTNIIIYLFDKGEKEKRATARRLFKDVYGKSKLVISSKVT